MEVNFKIIVWMLGILFTGLTAGLCFTWSNAITPGIGRLDDYGFLQSFQAMNRAIINPSFLIVFFGPVILLFVNAFLYRSAHPATFWSFILAALLFFFGIGLVTVFKNVPLNEILDTTVLEKATQLELADLRKTFEEPWNKWHTVRTVCSTLSFILLLTGIIVNK
ncbi:anthrone oxygenase family protein [Maribacter aurantiacus]|uniref:DUF1772 domain-containing protein n=1 Tax=Maribacter aurantiacus TaxID=1882343 RepID=A0A5R8M5G7_9FLAO|nr:DUF1772 domain-containing protein [Maribacter aurantiacus]TLF44807.1 DUF1772 domain-containing protein [Maribacter aurantiacus]